MSKEVSNLLDVFSLLKEVAVLLDESSKILVVKIRIRKTDANHFVTRRNATSTFAAIWPIQNNFIFFNIQRIYLIHDFFLKRVFLQGGLPCM